MYKTNIINRCWLIAIVVVIAMHSAYPYRMPEMYKSLWRPFMVMQFEDLSCNDW